LGVEQPCSHARGGLERFNNTTFHQGMSAFSLASPEIQELDQKKQTTDKMLPKKT
jgi:hypothetical protein